MAKKQTKKIKEERLEDILWSCRNHLRGKADMSDKRDVLLTLVFLKFMSDRFEEQQEKIRAKYPDAKLAEIQLKKPAAYGQDGVIFLPEECRWRYLVDSVEPKRKALALDNATSILDKQEEKLKNALPQNLFVSCDFEPSVLKSVMEELDKIDRTRFGEKDLIGRVYEYYLQAFSINADKEEGEFYTPRSLVELIATMIEPFDGTLYDPCCGSGGMFIQCAKLVEAHGGNTKSINVYGQESEPATFRLAKMNLAVRGISYHLGEKAASTFSNDQHKDLKVDYVMTNPPFNLKPWRTNDELLGDPRWKGYATPPDSNANYAWILHILSKLNPADGVAGFLLANGALDDGDTLEIRKKLIENDKVEAIIVLPREMFYSTDISVTLWIINQNKHGGIYHGRQLRDRTGEVLFIDLRTWNENIYEKKYVRLSSEQIAAAAKIYHDWQVNAGKTYAKPELYYSAKREELAANNYSLIPSRYIEFVEKHPCKDVTVALKKSGSVIGNLLQEQTANLGNLTNAYSNLDAIFRAQKSAIKQHASEASIVCLGDYIEPCDERNTDGAYSVEDVRGISIEKKIIPTKADMTGVSLKPYKLLKPNEFCFVPVTSRNGDKISLACNHDDRTYIVSSAYEVFRVVRSKELLPDFLFLLFARPEFDRYSRFNSWGSAREVFSYDDMKRVRILLPSLSVQTAIAAMYRSALAMKTVAEKLSGISRYVLPSVVHQALQEAENG